MSVRGLLLLMLITGCGESSSAGAPPARVVAVTSSSTEATEDDFCEQTFDSSAFEYPALTSETGAPANGTRWVNLWATWCAPCIEELPRLAAFESELSEDGTQVELVLLNADQDDSAFEAFVRDHPEVEGTLRMAEPDKLAEWTQGLGIAGSPTLPVHLLVNGENRLTCFRASGIRDDEYPALKAAVSP